jgi:2-dehydrotetronate isomerase
VPRFAANLSTLYPELGFFDRFEAAARDGFKAIEYQFPYAFDRREIAARLRGNGLQQVLLNAPPGDWERGERGLGCLPGRDAEFRAAFSKALDYASGLACPRIHVMAGIAPEGAGREALHETYVSRVRWAANAAAGHGVSVLIEPINTRDVPGYFLNRQQDAHQVLEEAGAPNLKVQMDLYHCQVMEGDLAMKLRRFLPTGNVGHMQIAGVPERHEPDVGELNYAYLFAVIDDCGYDGWIGCEYRPRAGAETGGTSAGLSWLRPYL